MKINNIAITAATLALAIVASANAAAPVALPAAKSAYTFDPFVSAEVGIVNGGLHNNTAGIGSFGKFKSEVGGGFTAGVLLNQHHEFSVSTGYVEFEGTPVVTPGIESTNGKVEQVPVLFNYAYHMPIDSKGMWTVYGGPTIGVIHQTTSLTTTQLGGTPAFLIGTNSVSDNLLAFGATVGVNAKLSSHWTVGASAQVLEVASSSGVPFAGTTQNLLGTGSATRTFFALTAGYSW